jgi:hypothetical protein
MTKSHFACLIAQVLPFHFREEIMSKLFSVNNALNRRTVLHDAISISLQNQFISFSAMSDDDEFDNEFDEAQVRACGELKKKE